MSEIDRLLREALAIQRLLQKLLQLRIAAKQQKRGIKWP